MIDNQTYIARGNQNQVSALREIIINLLDTRMGVQRSYEAARTLDEAMTAEPPRPEEVGLPQDSEFVQALSRYHANRPAIQQISTKQKCEIEKPYEWYINPVFGFSGRVGVVQDGYGHRVPVAAEVAEILREGTIKIDYNPDKTSTKLTVTMDYDQHSALSLSIISNLDQIFANAQCQGIDIDQQ